MERFHTFSCKPMTALISIQTSHIDLHPCFYSATCSAFARVCVGVTLEADLMTSPVATVGVHVREKLSGQRLFRRQKLQTNI